MKKIRALDNFLISTTQFAKPVYAHSRRLGLLTLSAALFLSGCNLFSSKQLYDDAYYTSNFIAGIPLSSFVGAAAMTDPTVPVTGQWDLSYRYLDWDGYNYITLTDSGTVAGDYAAADGLEATAPVYRLEVVNLIDGGNFETSAEDWTSTRPGLSSVTRWTSTTPLFGNGCAQIKLETGGEETYQSAAHAGFSGFSNTVGYNIFFRYASPTYKALVIFDEAIGDTPAKSITLNATSGGVQGDAKFTLNDGYTRAPEITFCPIDKAGTLDDFYVDNFRVGRSGNMELRLYLKIADTTPALESGTYSFSVWVYSDPLATSVQTPYPVDTFVVKMASCAGTIQLSTTSATYAAAPGWQKLTATLEPGALTFVEGTLDPVLGLVLDFNQSQPGSVLVAQPELRFYPEGL